MSGHIREYDLVRVRTLDGARVDGCGLSCRAPVIGDVGAVVALLSTEDGEDAYLVECVQADATVAWIAVFARDALERVGASGEASR